jgi:hypothetical protein
MYILFVKYRLCINFDKNGSGYIFCDFLQTRLVTLIEVRSTKILIPHGDIFVNVTFNAEAKSTIVLVVASPNRLCMAAA